MVAYRGYSTYQAGAASSFSCTSVSGITSGDFQLCIVTCGSTTEEMFREAGWNILLVDWTSAVKVFVLWRIYDGTDGAPLWTVVDGSANFASVQIVYSDVNQTNPIAGFNYQLNTTSSATVNIPELTNATANGMAVAIYTCGSTGGGSTWTNPSGYTERVDYDPSGTGRRPIGVAEKSVNEGTISSTTATTPGSASLSSIGIHLLLNDAHTSFHKTDWKYPGTVSTVSATTIGLSDGADWTSTSNAAASDNSRAQITGSATGYQSDLLKCTNFGFSLPLGATVTGIEVEVEGRAYFTGNHGLGTRYFQASNALYRAGTAESYIKINNIKFEALYNASPTSTDPADQTVTVGGPGDLWAASWTKSDIENSGFGCYVLGVMSADEGPNSGGGNALLQVDGVRMRIHFIPPRTVLYPPNF